MHPVNTLSCSLRSIVLLLLVAFTASGLASCSTYHNVATWYKYRKDFHLPKPVPAPEHAVAQAKAPEATPQVQPIVEDSQVQPENKSLARPTRKELRLERRALRAQARQGAMQRRVSRALEVATASTEGTVYYPILKSWERRLDDQQVPAQAAANRPISIPALLGFIFAVAGLILPFIFFLGGFLFWLAGLVLSIIGLTQTGPNKAHSGKGFAIAGLVITLVEFFLFILLIILIIAAFASFN